MQSILLNNKLSSIYKSHSPLRNKKCAIIPAFLCLSISLTLSLSLSLCKLFVGVSMADLKSTFLNVYSVLKSELLEDPAFEWTDDSRQWVERVRFLSISYSYIASHLFSHHSSSAFCSFIFDRVSTFVMGLIIF